VKKPPKAADGEEGQVKSPKTGKNRVKKAPADSYRFSATDPVLLTGSAGQTLLNVAPEAVTRYRQWHVRLNRSEPLPARLGIVSALADEGVQQACLALAAVMASDLEDTFCVVELDWWKPALASLMQSEPNPGMAQVLIDEASLDQALRSTSLENLWYLPAGDLPGPRRSRLSHSQLLSTTLDALNERFDHLIIEIPSILAVGDSAALAAHADCLCLVIRQGITPLPLVRQALDEIAHLPVRGVVLNGDRLATPRWLLRLLSGDWVQ